MFSNKEVKRQLDAFIKKQISDETVDPSEVVQAHILRLKLRGKAATDREKESTVRSIETLLFHEYEYAGMLVAREIARHCEDWPDKTSRQSYKLLADLAGRHTLLNDFVQHGETIDT